MSTLRFNTNWRSLLWIVGSGEDIDYDTPVNYVYLDPSKVSHNDVQKFCSDNWNRYDFDYDPHNCCYVWPINKVSAQDLVGSINRDFPKLASVVEKSPSEVHNLSFTSGDSASLNFDV